LTLPRELTASQPRNSFLFNAHADPPTATLQRIKALVTGSLPTFVDLGFNFGGASIAEDSIVQQLRQANKTVRLPRTALPMGSLNLLFHR
jgi:phosphatidylinositol glycan class O